MDKSIENVSSSLDSSSDDVSYWFQQIINSNISFVTCLASVDQQAFAKWFAMRLAESSVAFERKHEILRSGVQLSIWIDGIRELSVAGKFKYNYSLVRKAFWGENRRGKKLDDLSTSYTVVMRDFTLPVALSRIYIMYDKNQLTQIPHCYLKPSLKVDELASEDVANNSAVYSKKEDVRLVCSIM